MSNVEYLYDVAFSFLAADERLAVQLNDILQKSCKTFLYSERQKELAGTDGEGTFSKVFGEQARCAVILYRPEWGTTRWTRIEETAIRNRAHDEGYDFALFVPLHQPPSVPKWMPKNRLWIGLERWGVESAAAVIEARAQELGAAPHVETIEERAVREAHALDFAADRRVALGGVNGVQAFTRNKERLLEEIVGTVDRVNGPQQVFRLEAQGFQGGLWVQGAGEHLTIDGGPRYANEIGEGALHAKIWPGMPPLPGYLFVERPQHRKERVLYLDYSPGREYVWRAKADPRSQWSNAALAEELVRWYLDTAGRS